MPTKPTFGRARSVPNSSRRSRDGQRPDHLPCPPCQLQRVLQMATAPASNRATLGTFRLLSLIRASFVGSQRIYGRLVFVSIYRASLGSARAEIWSVRFVA
jgi:hypothetical protein